MFFKTVSFALLLVQAISGQCIPAWNQAGPCQAGPYPAGPYQGWNQWNGEAYSPAMLAASNGGGLAIASSSPIAPLGVTMTSENAIEGPLAVAGQIPFLGAVGVEGLLPTAGAGAISYGSGNGQVAILAEDLAGYGAFAPGFAGYNNGFGAWY